MDLSALSETSSDEAGKNESAFAPPTVAVAAVQAPVVVAAAPLLAAAPPPAEVSAAALLAAAPPLTAAVVAPPLAPVVAVQPLAPVAEAQPLAPVVAVQPLAPVAARHPLGPVLDELMAFDGSIGVALVDSQSGMVLGEAGSASNMEIAAAGASEILRARLATNKALGLAEDIADVLITLSRQIQIIHPLSTNSSLFVYMIGDKAKSSLAMARYKAAEADSNIRM